MHKEQTSAWFAELQNLLIASYEGLEAEGGGSARFERSSWERPGGGGGTMAVLRGGAVFEKAGVNTSVVHGEFSEAFRKEIPGAEADPRFWATGTSVVVHPRSPLVPAVHFNTRTLITTHPWFGGGADMTPVFEDEQDSADFHGALKSVCDAHAMIDYEAVRARCDRYFYLKHRKEMRGIGGIFFDQLRSDDWQQDFAFVQALGRTFLEVYPPIVRRHMNRPYGDAERQAQLVKRGRYVEFNLLYDRGTRFGLETDGNVDAILMSMPPMASW